MEIKSWEKMILPWLFSKRTKRRKQHTQVINVYCTLWPLHILPWIHRPSTSLILALATSVYSAYIYIGLHLLEYELPLRSSCTKFTPINSPEKGQMSQWMGRRQGLPSIYQGPIGSDAPAFPPGRTSRRGVIQQPLSKSRAWHSAIETTLSPRPAV